MAIWHRFRPSTLHSLSTLRRTSIPFHSPGATAIGPLSSPAIAGDAHGFRPSHFICGFNLNTVRSFAAPVQVKSKHKSGDSDSSGPRLNEAITGRMIRLVSDQGHNIVPLKEALAEAKKLDLDLVEVQRNANPPVCKIMDFHKEKFKQDLKEKERAKSKSAGTLKNGENKEIRFKGKTELKDLQTKADQVIRLMERGHRVKCMAMPTGKEELDLGGLLARLLTLIEDVSIIESGPHVDSTKAYVIVRHVKFATKKSGKKVSQVMDTVAEGAKSPAVITSLSVASVNKGGVLAEEEWKQVESSEDEDDALFNQEDNIQDSTSIMEAGWSKRNKTVDFDSQAASRDSGFTQNAFSDASYEGEKSRVPLQKTSSPSPVNQFTGSKPGLGSLVDKLGKIPKEPSVVEPNRYSKQTQTKGRLHHPNMSDRNNAVPYNRPGTNQGRMLPVQSRSDNQGRDQVGSMQRQFNPNTQTPQTSRPGDDRGPTVPGNHSSEMPKLGIFTNSLHEKTTNPTYPTSAKPRYGIFNSDKPPDSINNTKSVDDAVKPNAAATSAPKYGIFSVTKNASSGN